MKNIVIFLSIFLVPLTFWAQKKVSANVEVKKVSNGKSFTITKEIYFNSNGKMVVHFSYPDESYIVTNNFGEAKVYNPRTNEVMVINDNFLSSENELLYYFLSNKIDDLGLKDLGFSLSETKTEGRSIVRTYMPSNSKSNYYKVVMVHENHLPIYCAYYTSKAKISLKIYYSDYKTISSITFPNRITEIAYSGKDSTISRMVYSNLKVDKEANSSVFDFVIPPFAKTVKSTPPSLPTKK